jgi:hypothetical protein
MVKGNTSTPTAMNLELQRKVIVTNIVVTATMAKVTMPERLLNTLATLARSSLRQSLRK